MGGTSPPTPRRPRPTSLKGPHASPRTHPTSSGCLAPPAARPAALRVAGPIAYDATTVSAPSSSHPGVPHPTRSEVSTSGPSVRATVTPVPKKPWYSPTRPAGARSNDSCQEPADCPISATTWSTAPTTSAPAATHGEAPADSANTAHAPSMTQPERRTARVADASPVTPRAVRTWNSITAPVLSTNSADTSQVGAVVRSAIHSGSPRLSSGIRSSRTVLRSVITAYGRSRSTPSVSRLRTATGATAGSRSNIAAHTRKLAASRANTARYAARVPACNASPPSPAPTASPALSVACRCASSPVRSPTATSPASSACRAAARPDCAVAYAQAARTNGTNPRTTRNEATAAPVPNASSTAVPRAPRRSATRPSGTPASEPTAQATVSPSPTRAGARPTTWVK